MQLAKVLLWSVYAIYYNLKHTKIQTMTQTKANILF